MNRIKKTKLLISKKNKASAALVMLKIIQLKNEAAFHRDLAKIYQRKANNIQQMLALETIQTRSIGSIPRISTFFEKQVPTMNECEFRSNFKVCRFVFNFLVRELEGLRKKVTKFKVPISLDKRIAIALYALGNYD